jgi:hypothetical protein
MMGIEQNNFISFFNNSNLKHEIQNRIDADIETRFKESLNFIKGDKNEGLDFSEVVKLAIAYFFSEIFKHPVKNEYYTLEYVKGFLDADNKTLYTEIHNVPKPFYRLTNTSLFSACWLIIQTAWFVNSEHFGKHQLIEYLNHYIGTGDKLPIEDYEFDAEYLIKKYNDYDKKIFNGNTKSFVYGWFNAILFLVCCEVQLPLNGFKVSVSGDREYNPLTKCLKLLRSLMPFKVIENDIKNAFVSFLDIETGARLADTVYTQLMKSKNISRPEAKKLFNSVCNSGLKEYMNNNKLKDFFYACGYSEKQTERIVQIITDKEFTFFEAMTEYERQAIEIFNRRNALIGTGRVHDAVMYIDQGLRPMVLKSFSTVFFGHKEMNAPVLSDAYYYDKRWLPYAHVSSIPRGLPLVHRLERNKPPVKGNANGFIFYDGVYEYITASFNLNEWVKFKDGNADVFFDECLLMFGVLQKLNDRNLTYYEVESIVRHIRENSNHIFDKRYLIQSYNGTAKDGKIKMSDYGFTEHLAFKQNIDFLTAMSEAKGIVNTMRNYKEIFDLLYERISNDDYSFLTESYSITGRKSNSKVVRLIVRRWNILTSGYVRKPSVIVKNNTLYNTPIKKVTISSNAERQRKFKERKTEAKKLELITNRPKARQLIFIVGIFAGIVPEVNFLKDEGLITELKLEILDDYKSQTKVPIELGSFDEVFPVATDYEIKPLNTEQTEFDTDMTHSIFNQYDEIQAIQQAGSFYKEWQKFHNVKHYGESRKCKVTGVDIGMQKEGSILLSEVGLKHYKELDPDLFNQIKTKYLSKKWSEANETVQIKEITHNIRNYKTMHKQKQEIMHIASQPSLLSQLFT